MDDCGASLAQARCADTQPCCRRESGSRNTAKRVRMALARPAGLACAKPDSRIRAARCLRAGYGVCLRARFVETVIPTGASMIPVTGLAMSSTNGALIPPKQPAQHLAGDGGGEATHRRWRLQTKHARRARTVRAAQRALASTTECARCAAQAVGHRQACGSTDRNSVCVLRMITEQHDPRAAFAASTPAVSRTTSRRRSAKPRARYKG